MKNPDAPFFYDANEINNPPAPAPENSDRAISVRVGCCYEAVNPEAPFMETCGVSTQESAEGIVLLGTQEEGPNVEMSEASNELVVGVDSDWMSRTPARHGIAFPRSCLGVSVVYILDRDLIPAKAR